MKYLPIILIFLLACQHSPGPTAAELDGSHVDSLAATPEYTAYQDFCDTTYDRLRNLEAVRQDPGSYTNVRWMKRKTYDSANRILQLRRAYFARNGRRAADSIRKLRDQQKDTASIDITPDISQ